ncbi:MAG: hypothetical protein ABI534_11290 [Chloroflexota bacterium]
MQRHRRIDRCRRIIECRVCGITDALEDLAAARRHRRLQQLVVPRKRIARELGEALEEAGALDIGEEECDGG